MRAHTDTQDDIYNNLCVYNKKEIRQKPNEKQQHLRQHPFFSTTEYKRRHTAKNFSTNITYNGRKNGYELIHVHFFESCEFTQTLIHIHIDAYTCRKTYGKERNHTHGRKCNGIS